MLEIYNPAIGEYEKLSKDKVLKLEDIEGNKPCDLCWESARDYGVYSWPLKKSFLDKCKRCKCGRKL